MSEKHERPIYPFSDVHAEDGQRYSQRIPDEEHHEESETAAR